MYSTLYYLRTPFPDSLKEMDNKETCICCLPVCSKHWERGYSCNTADPEDQGSLNFLIGINEEAAIK